MSRALKPRRVIRTGFDAAPTSSFRDFAYYVRASISKNEIVKCVSEYLSKTESDASFILKYAPEYLLNDPHSVSAIAWAKLGLTFEPREYKYHFFNKENVEQVETRVQHYDGYATIAKFVTKLRDAAAKIAAEKKPTITEEILTAKKAPDPEKLVRMKLISVLDEHLFDISFEKEKALSVISLIRSANLPVGLATSSAKKFLEDRLSTYKELISSKDEDLLYAYQHLSKAKIRRLIGVIETMISECSTVSAVSSLRKPRLVKPKSSAILVKYMRFKLEDTERSLKSVQPISIIGAQRAYFFNTKTLELSMYVAANSTGLSVKGASVIDFDESLSKRARILKNMAFLEVVLKRNEKAIDNEWSKIRSKIRIPSGRVGSDTIILRTAKG